MSILLSPSTLLTSLLNFASGTRLFLVLELDGAAEAADEDPERVGLVHLDGEHARRPHILQRVALFRLPVVKHLLVISEK